MNTTPVTRSLFAPALAAVALALLPSAARAGFAFDTVNLVSDIPGLAAFTDPNLKNPWGISSGPTTPFWVSNAETGTSTLYNTAGTPQALVVTTPAPGGGRVSPTGQVFNAGTAFNGDRFIFASEEGTITGWRGALGTVAETLFDNSAVDAVYKGLGIGTVGTGTYLYAADFHNARIDIFGSAGAPALAGAFVDPTLPATFAPFNIQNLGGSLYVTYAKQDAAGFDDVAGAGNGFVSVFDLNGNFLRRLVSGGPLNSPWGVALAPAGFGDFGGQLLVGNFGDGRINVFNSTTGAYIDALRRIDGTAIEFEGLWGLKFGNGGTGGALDKLYFTAGIGGEEHGLFGSISATPVPEPSTVFSALVLVLGCAGTAWARRRRAA